MPCATLSGEEQAHTNQFSLRLNRFAVSSAPTEVSLARAALAFWSLGYGHRDLQQPVKHVRVDPEHHAWNQRQHHERHDNLPDIEA